MTDPMNPRQLRERIRERGCGYCRKEPEPGWIETDNNGPIVRCPFCERREALRTALAEKG